MDEMDALVERVRTDGPVSLPLDGWDRASIWGWDAAAGSLYAHLWRNTDDPAKPPTIRIGPDDLTPVITCPVTLTQYIAMAVDRDPWEVIGAVDLTDYEGVGHDTDAPEGGTVVTMTEGYSLPEWPYRPQPW
jgi:hypothetical protein